MSLYDSLFGQSPKPSQESLKRYQEALANQQQQAMGLNQAGKSQAQTQYLGQLNSAGYATTVSNVGYVCYNTASNISTISSSSPVVLKLLPEETCVQALVGWRRWSVPMFEEKLLSNNATVWKPYKALAAKCSAITNPNGTCQGLSCGCGIYSYKTRKMAESGDNAASQVTHVWGEVWLWGRVIEYTQGFRAQFAYPKAFVDTGGIARKMAQVFGIKTMPL